MKNKKTFLSSKRGFTLVEMLLTITILGIFAVIVLVSLGNSRTKSRDASVFSSVSSAGNVAMVCSSNLLNITNPTLYGAVCAGMGSYANITLNSSGWSYASYTIGANTCTQDLTASDGSFAICARYSTTKGIRCTENGCSKVGF
jgi:prepilin-type N-terminal cleavage/methylation domain-containing protein